MFEYFAGCYFGGWRQVYFVLWILPSRCHPLGWSRTQLGKINPRPFTKRLVFVWWPQSRGWSEMHSTRHPKAGRAPSSQKSAARAGCQDSVCVGLELGSFVIWSLPKVTAGEGTLWGCAWRAMPLGPPSPCLRLLHHPRGARTSPRSPWPHRLEKKSVWFFQLWWKPALTQQSVSGMKNRKVARWSHSACFSCLFFLFTNQNGARWNRV